MAFFAIAIIGSLWLHLPFGANILIFAGGALLAAVVLFSAHATGSFFLQLLSRSEAKPEDSEDVSTPLVIGLGILSFAVYILAASGLYHSSLGAGLMGTGLLAGGRISWRQWNRRCAGPWSRRISGKFVKGAAIPSLVALLLAAGAPVVFWDSHSYHLAIPEIIAATGHLPNSPSYIYGFYAIACECIYALVLAPPFGEAAAQVLNAAFFVLAAVVATASLPPDERPWARTLLVCTPGLVMLAFLPKNTGLLALATMVAMRHAMDDDGGVPASESARTRIRPILAGAALGVALATHHAALIVLPVLLAGVVRGWGVRAALVSLGVALIIPAPMYLRNLLMTHNPVYPFLISIFGGQSPAPILISADPGSWSIEQILSMVLSPWYQFEPEGVGSTFGPAVPLGIALAFLSRKVDRPLALRALAGVFILVVGGVIFGRPRYGITGIFLLAPLASRGLNTLPILTTSLLFIQSLAAALLLLAGPLRPLDAGFTMNPTAYRSRVVPTWTIAAVAKDQLPEDARIASVGILRPYGWGGKLEECSENMLPAIGLILPRVSTGEEAARALRDLDFGYWATDFQEMERLGKGYGYLRLSPREQNVLNELIAVSRPLATGSRCGLYELPTDSTVGAPEVSP
jgi:hypothetical protein